MGQRRLIQEYRGEQRTCQKCGKYFRDGEKIMVVLKDILFCCSILDDGPDCFSDWSQEVISQGFNNVEFRIMTYRGKDERGWLCAI